MADLKLGNILPVGADNVVVEGKYVKGGYVVVTTIEERDSLKGSDGQNIVNGSLCFCQADSKFYQYNGNEWIEAEFGSDIPLEAGKGENSIQQIGNQAAVTRSVAGGFYSTTGVKGFKIANIETIEELHEADDPADTYMEIYHKITFDISGITDSNPDGNSGCATQLQNIEIDILDDAGNPIFNEDGSKKTQLVPDPRFPYVHFLTWFEDSHALSTYHYEIWPSSIPAVKSFSSTNAQNWQIEYEESNNPGDLYAKIKEIHYAEGDYEYPVIDYITVTGLEGYMIHPDLRYPEFMFLQGNPFYHQAYYFEKLENNAAYYLEDILVQGPQSISLNSAQIKAFTSLGLKIGTNRTNQAFGHHSVTTSEFATSDGNRCFAIAPSSYAARKESRAYGSMSKADGEICKVTRKGTSSSATGFRTIADAQYANASGAYTVAKGYASDARNLGTITEGNAQTALGKYNIPDADSLLIVGRGSSDKARANALKLDTSGNLEISGKMKLTKPASTDTDYAATVSYVNEYVADQTDDVNDLYKIIDGTPGLRYEVSAETATCYGFEADAEIPTKVIVAKYYKGLPVTTLSSGAFYEIDNFDSSPEINRYANIQEIVLQEPLNYIAGNALLSCVNLKQITLPETLTLIGTNAFANEALQGARSIENINITGDIDTFCAINFANKRSNPLIMSAKSSVIDGVTVYTNATLNGNEIKKIPDSVKALGGWNFAELRTIETANLSNVNSWRFDGQQFNGCSNLAKVSLPTHTAVNYIPQYCFQNCPIDKLTIPSNITHIYYNGLKINTTCTITLESAVPPYLHNGPNNQTKINPFNYSSRYRYTFKVPKGSLSMYEDIDNLYGWKNIYASEFTTFEEYDSQEFYTKGEITERFYTKAEVEALILKAIEDALTYRELK